MKDRLSLLPMKALAALCLLLGLAPACLVAGRALLPDAPFLWYALPVGTYLWGVGGYLLPGKGRLPFALLGCVLLLAAGFLVLLPYGALCFLLLIPCILMLLLLPSAWARPIWEEWTLGMGIAGLALHLAGQMLSGQTMFASLRGPLTITFAAFVFLVLMTKNRLGLRDGMHGAQKAPAPLRHRNTVLVVGLFTVSLLASCWETLGRWVETAWNAIRWVIGVVVKFLLSLFPEQSMGGSGGGYDPSELIGMAEESGPSPFAVFMEYVFKVLAVILMAVAAVLALRVIIRGLRKVWKKLMERLRRFAAAAGEDYVDVAESTRNLEETARTLRQKVQKALEGVSRPPKWEEMDGRGRVRRLYQQFLKKRPEARNRTAREALAGDGRISRAQADAFTDLYERARYSDHMIDAKDADRLKNELRG